MTRKEIIDGLQFTVDMFLFDPMTGETLTEPMNDMDKITIDACKGAIEILEKMPNVWHWKKMDVGFSKYKCSRCGEVEFKNSKYCPNCGAYLIYTM